MKISWTLSEYEEKIILPLVEKMLNHRDKEKVFSNTEIRNTLIEFGEYKITDADIRKIVYHIRQRGITSLLIANSNGYYKASNIQEVNVWIATHKGKIQKMINTLNAIEKQFEEQKHKLITSESSLTGQVSIFEYIDYD